LKKRTIETRKHGGERRQSRKDFRMEESCDLVVIGGGQAGILLAQDLAAAGKQIVLVERKYLGGSVS
jgi:glycerol-3-phosphate dehydrogenase